MRRALIGVGLLVVAACGQVSSNVGDRVGTTKQELSSYDSDGTALFTGDDLADHELAFTFDDGPGPLDVSGALATWLSAHKDPKTGQPQPIHATFFVNGACVAHGTLADGPSNGSCDEPTPGADAVLAKVVAEGHYIGNHTTTHR